MDYSEVVKRLAPCGLDCSRCADYENGEIKELSNRLISLLGNYGRLASLKADIKPVFSGYAQFQDVINIFSQASCSGCRGDNNVCFIQCKFRTCHKEKGVDFCFQCPDYPCDNESSTVIQTRWKQNNDKMKESGVVQFYRETVKLPRY